ncbi:malic enzyme, NAD binding domain protein [Necator americanus]|uniref:Malic enzyme, NAD binding domain protein n=1 Tax=Necator americanus TaxID=51031 RepID=W2THL1_NECAM|nr:malic enzyme, NAD binding domain protein [Necator americanus]ETN81089.1 malic enzyme, NAD binding domain protein [Necator americanus]
MAFSLFERQYLGLHGLIPPAFMTEEQQAYRIMAKLRKQPDNLSKYIQLDALHDRNEKLFYRVLCDNVKELLPIVYTPTVGLACQKFGFIYRNPKGLYVTINDNSISKIYQILSNWPTQNVKAIVVTDGERILGLGDLGTYGIGIPVGKLSLYVALAGVQPEWCLPVIIDVGTDNLAATGVAELCVRAMSEEGLSEEEACSKIFLMDIDGLVTKSRHNTLPDNHLKFAKDMPDTKNLLEVVKTVKPDGLIGASTVGGSFTEEIITEMARINQRPIIFALSNPTSKAECTAEDAYRITNGSVLFASGSPFENVEIDGRIFKPGQGNNSYIFPGVALAAILFKAKHIPDQVFLIAARCTSEFVTEKSLQTYARLYPRLKDIRELSVLIAIEIGNYLYERNLATLHPEPEDKEMFIRQQIYSVEYDELINRTYEWPPKDMKHGFPVPVMERASMDEE